MPITLDGTLGVGTPGITLAGGAITANANQLNSSAEDVNSENRIINGDFGIWQRGTSSALLGYVAADRWYNSFVGGTVTQSRQGFAVGDTLGAIQPTFFLRQTISGQTLPAQYAAIIQLVEGVRSYAGQTITVLGWARRSSGATGNMTLEAYQNFGTGGGSVNVNVPSPTTITLGSTWAPFAVVMSIPSVATKTIGSGSNDHLGMNFWTSAGSDWNARTNSLGLQTIGVDLWGIHIRVGTWTAADAALYRPRDQGTEFALCQRYYEVFPATSAINGLYVNAFLYTVSKRGQPQVNLVSGNLAGGVFTANAYGIGQSTNSTGASNVTLGIDAEL